MGGAKEVRDLWAHTQAHAETDYSYTLPAHGAALLKVH
ncbi:hypothetical protein EM6_0858 [Asticcacaulis excentricus]|uniref:Alpha galactosidase C-terminal domain-containing protein n=1 Tax=Asticcacaulis excentricus TaxID=78587 RepID=A0A3G9G7M2_9CAUL|nr:hypothetical protein EM6_0858 [Asticcacaulis excentricus]